MAKPAKAVGKKINAKTAAALILAAALVLTAVFAVLGVRGARLDREGLYRLLPWIPFPGGQGRWRSALVPGADLGSTQEYYFLLAEGAEGGAAADRAVELLNARLEDAGWRDALVDRQADGRLRIALPASQAARWGAGLLARRGDFAFADPEGQVFLTGDHIVNAAYQSAGADGNFSLSFVFDEEGRKIFGSKSLELIGKSIRLMMDGEILREPSINMALTEGSVSIPGFTQEEALGYAVLMRSGPLPTALEDGGSKPGLPGFGAGAEKRLMAGLGAASGLLMIWFLIRYRAAGLVAAWMLGLHLAFVFFCAALIRAGFSVPTLMAVFSTFSVLAFLMSRILEAAAGDIRRGRSARQALGGAYASAGHLSLDVLTAFLVLSVILMIMDTGALRAYLQLFSLGVLTDLVLVHLVLRFLLLQSSVLLGEKAFLCRRALREKEAV